MIRKKPVSQSQGGSGGGGTLRSEELALQAQDSPRRKLSNVSSPLPQGKDNPRERKQEAFVKEVRTLMGK